MANNTSSTTSPVVAPAAAEAEVCAFEQFDRVSFTFNGTAYTGTVVNTQKHLFYGYQIKVRIDQAVAGMSKLVELEGLFLNQSDLTLILPKQGTAAQITDKKTGVTTRYTIVAVNNKAMVLQDKDGQTVLAMGHGYKKVIKRWKDDAGNFVVYGLPAAAAPAADAETPAEISETEGEEKES